MRTWPSRLAYARLFLVVLIVGSALVLRALGQAPPPAPAPAAQGTRPAQPPEITAANATGDAAEIFKLEQKIEEATVKGDVKFADSVMSSDFHFRHGDGWTRGIKTGGIEDDRASYMRRIKDKEYYVHDIDASIDKIEMHGDVAITWGRYVSLFLPVGRNPDVPGRLTTIWYERVFAKRDGRWQWVSHRTVWGPNNSPAGMDPTQVSAAAAASYVPGLPATKAPAEVYKPETKEAADLLAFEEKLAAAVPGGDLAFYNANTADDFIMFHGDVWTRGGRAALVDTKQSFGDRVKSKQYLAWNFDSRKAEMHGDIGITYGRYTATLKGSNPDRAWFAVWYQRVYQQRGGHWMMLSQRTVHGASYGPTRESVSEK